MSIFYHLIAMYCFGILGFVVMHVNEGTSPLWAFPWTIFLAVPSIAIGMWIGGKMQGFF